MDLAPVVVAAPKLLQVAAQRVQTQQVAARKSLAVGARSQQVHSAVDWVAPP
jgi:hypothetical protein